uniref:Phospholipid N-methyltransferase n=1 Tax=Candidatus Kentrum eta TaxID=2126337 RepID=A0A450VS02_9GAMM|nr:MAG: Phospholipid N-methyltransferase [Candidatus Kentron sp. H]VFK04462.1 MAG: Phospholipid N-methyltransferase [Candidatus Kentron sp. H]VFK07538.1 MAG: Phospholipid N-methyltransferase [Candidatus Kentron sp. H]
MTDSLQNSTRNNTGQRSANNGRAFFREFLKQPLQIGSIVPSSRYLERRIIDAAAVAFAKTIVELGSGTGGITRAILRAMPADAVLLSIEINARFHHIVQQIRDDRLISHLGNAYDLQEILLSYDLPAPQVIISSIPFSSIHNHHGARVCEVVTRLLTPGGHFVAFAYQFNSRVVTLCRPLLGKEKKVLELLNIPPARVYRWQKMVL